MEVEGIHREVTAPRIGFPRTERDGFRTTPIGCLVIFPERRHLKAAPAEEDMHAAELLPLEIRLRKKHAYGFRRSRRADIDVLRHLPQEHIPHASADPPRVVPGICELLSDTIRPIPLRRRQRSIGNFARERHASILNVILSEVEALRNTLDGVSRIIYKNT